jgi:hypothetical protein
MQYIEIVVTALNNFLHLSGKVGQQILILHPPKRSIAKGLTRIWIRIKIMNRKEVN